MIARDRAEPRITEVDAHAIGPAEREYDVDERELAGAHVDVRDVDRLAGELRVQAVAAGRQMLEQVAAILAASQRARGELALGAQVKIGVRDRIAAVAIACHSGNRALCRALRVLARRA